MSSLLWLCLSLLSFAVLSAHARPQPEGYEDGESLQREQPDNLHHSFKDLHQAASKTFKDVGDYMQQRVMSVTMQGLNKLSAPVAKVLAPVVYLRDHINSMFGMSPPGEENISSWCPTCLQHDYEDTPELPSQDTTECVPGYDGCLKEKQDSAVEDYTLSTLQQENIVKVKRPRNFDMIEFLLMSMANKDRTAIEVGNGVYESDNEIVKSTFNDQPFENALYAKESNSILSDSSANNILLI